MIKNAKTAQMVEEGLISQIKRYCRPKEYTKPSTAIIWVRMADALESDVASKRGDGLSMTVDGKQPKRAKQTWYSAT